MKKIGIKEKVILIILAFLLSLSICWRSGNGFQYVTFFVIAAVISIILIYVWPKIVTIKSQKNTEIKKWEFIIYAIIICLPLVIGILAHFPGITTADTGAQWLQTQSNQYSNWHPVMHTLFALKLPSLFYNNILSATIFQCLIIFGILLYFCYFCRKNFLNFYQTLIVLIMIVANPLFICFSVTIWKDITYSWFMFLATLFLIKIATSDGDWLLKNKNKIVFILSVLGVMLFRHNGIAPVLIMFIWLIIFYPKIRKISAIMFVSLFAFYFLLTGPVYKMLNINNKTGGKGEISGEIMGQISYYYNNGAEFTKKELRLLEDIASLDKWHKFYNPRNFNNLKWNSDNYSGALEENFSEYLKLYFKKSLQHPVMFVKSFFNMTSPVWETNSYIQGVSYTQEFVYDAGAWLSYKGDFKETSDAIYRKLANYNNFITTSPLRWLFVSIGQGMWLLLFGIALLICKYKDYLKKLLPYTLVLANSLVIMLLITGEEYRFVYAQAICVIPLLIYSLFYYSKNKSKEVKGK